MKQVAVLVAQCYWYDKQLGSCAKSRSLLTGLVYFPCLSALVLGGQHHFSPVSLLMIMLCHSVFRLLKLTQELGLAGSREEQNGQHQKFIFCDSL